MSEPVDAADPGVLALLESHPLFGRFSSDERRLLAGAISTRELFPGEAICREGGLPNEWYVLVEGKARVSRTRTDGGQEILSYLEPGAVFGVIGVLDGGRRSATVAALQPASCLVFPRALLEDDNTRLTLCLGELLCMALNHQLRAVNQRLLGMAREVNQQEGPTNSRSYGGWRLPSSSSR